MSTVHTPEQIQTARTYLSSAIRNIDERRDPISVLVAEIYGAAAYGEGDILEIAARLAVERTRQLQHD